MILKKRKFDAGAHIALSALLLCLIWPGLSGAADFYSAKSGSWFHGDTWSQIAYPGSGDNVVIDKPVGFDSTTGDQVIAVNNLNLQGGSLGVSGPGSLSMAGTNSYWNGGDLQGPLLQSGSLTLAGTNTVGDSGFLSNQGVVNQSANATLNIGWGSHFVNLVSGAYYLQGDGSIINVGIYYTHFSNAGLLCKRGGSGTSTLGVPFDNSDGTVEVDSGTLSLAAGGSSTNGTFNVASGAVLDLTGGSGPTWAGLVSGSGAGTVLLSGGTLNTSPSLTLNFPDGLFRWTGGVFSGTTINSDVVTIAGTGTAGLAGGFYNSGLVRQTNTASLDIGGYAAFFVNQAGGTYDIEGDGGMINSDNAWYTSFNNYGLLRKSGGNGTSTIRDPFYNYNGTIEVDSGTLSLANNGTSSNGTFIATAGGVLDWTGGSSPTWAGQVNGSGTGTVSLSSGAVYTSPSLTLNLPNGLLQWSGGWFSGTTINSNVVTISGTNTVSTTGIFYNAGLVRHNGTAALAIQNSAHFQNLAGGTYDFTGDGNIIGVDTAYYPSYFDNFGLLRKSGGAGTSAFGNRAWCNNYNGTIEVDSGTLSLAAGGSSSNGTFNVASGAVLDLTGGSSPTWAGTVTGSGTGTVSLNSGVVNTSPSLTLNLPDGLLQWSGGWFSGTTINSNVVTISGTNTVSTTGIFYNSGLMRHTGTAKLAIQNSAHFQNLAGGTYDFTGDGNIIGLDNAYYPSYFDNLGLLRKSGGAGTSAFGYRVWCNNYNGTIEVDSGTLSLAAGGSSSNGTFNVASGAVLDLTGGSSPTWAGTVTGSGTGTVSLNSGVVNTSPSLTLNLPDGLLQWSGGWFSGTTINSNVVTISGTNTVSTTGIFYNSGLMRHTGTATLAIQALVHFQNLAGGTYDFTGDGNIIGWDTAYYPSYFDNFGLLRKSGGAATSAIGNRVWFNNQNGSIEVDSGQLSLSGQSYVQGTGSFTVTLAGTDANQFGQLACGSAALSGPLNVKLAGGFVPAIGTQFQILSSGNLSAAFSMLNVPGGIAVTYSNNSVFLTVTGTVTGKLVGPAVAGSNFTFSVVTVSNQSYTIQRNDDLDTMNWVFFTNFTGDGSLLQLVAPVTNAPQRYFRLRQP